MAWTVADIPDQSGRIAVVTGSNTGLGLETAAELAAKGAKVVLACRTPSKAEAAAAEIRSRHAGADVEVLELDLGSLAQIRTAAAEVRDRFQSIDLLVNNAGVMIPPYSKTADGFELQFGTNHLGHFAFTGLILDRLTSTEGSRIVNVSSLAHQTGKMRWDDLDWTKGYKRLPAYGQSKLANLLFTYELDRRLTAAGAPTVSLAAHPGVSSTELARHVPGGNSAFMKKVGSVVMDKLISQPPDAGALPSLRAATDPAATGSEYYGPDGPREMRGSPVLTASAKHARDQADWARLWDVSVALTGVDPAI